MDSSRLDTPQSINMKLNSTLPDSNFSKGISYDRVEGIDYTFDQIY